MPGGPRKQSLLTSGARAQAIFAGLRSQTSLTTGQRMMADPGSGERSQAQYTVGPAWDPSMLVGQIVRVDGDNVIVGLGITQITDLSGGGNHWTPVSGFLLASVSTPAQLGGRNCINSTADAYAPVTAGPWDGAGQHTSWQIYYNADATSNQMFWGCQTGRLAQYMVRTGGSPGLQAIYDGSVRNFSVNTAVSVGVCEVVTYNPGVAATMYRAGVLAATATHATARAIGGAWHLFSDYDNTLPCNNLHLAFWCVTTGLPAAGEIANFAAWSLANYGV